MKHIILFFLLTFFSFTKVNASISPVIFKAKIVLKNKTSFTAYYLSWDTETTNSKGEYIPDTTWTDKEFQLFINRQNNKFYYDKGSIGFLKGVMFYKNIYGIKKPETMQIPFFGFCNNEDIVFTNANDILYTVFLGINKPNFPQFDCYGIEVGQYDSSSTEDLKQNEITSNFVLTDPKDLSFAFHFITTDKVMTSKKLKTIILSKKYDIAKMDNDGDYFNSIKTEMAKQRIYVFSEYQD
jgi:hypothetical protein